MHTEKSIPQMCRSAINNDNHYVQHPQKLSQLLHLQTRDSQVDRDQPTTAQINCQVNLV